MSSNIYYLSVFASFRQVTTERFLLKRFLKALANVTQPILLIHPPWRAFPTCIAFVRIYYHY